MGLFFISVRVNFYTKTIVEVGMDTWRHLLALLPIHMEVETKLYVSEP